MISSQRSPVGNLTCVLVSKSTNTTSFYHIGFVTRTVLTGSGRWEGDGHVLRHGPLSFVVCPPYEVYGLSQVEFNG